MYQPTFDFCRSLKNGNVLPFDYLIEELNLIIELDGGQHFVQVANWGDFELVVDQDVRKMKQIVTNGYSIIRIYQPDVFGDKNNWKENLKNAIKQYEKETIVYIPAEIYQNHINKYNNATKKKQFIIRPKPKQSLASTSNDIDHLNANLNNLDFSETIKYPLASTSSDIDNLNKNLNISEKIKHPVVSNSSDMPIKKKIIMRSKKNKK